MNIMWFRQDLRVSDNPALCRAAESDVLPIYIFDQEAAGAHKMGGASKVWLHHALSSLNQSLDGALQFFNGDAEQIIKKLCAQYNIEGVYWNRCYEPWRIAQDKSIKKNIKQSDIDVESFNSSLLWEPWEVLKNDGTPYKVFTPFYRKKCLKVQPPHEPLQKPSLKFNTQKVESVPLESLELLPKKSWKSSLVKQWDISETGALERLRAFMNEGINHYADGRNFPACDYVSRLSPYLHFGQISPHQVWHESLHHDPNKNIDTFQSELGWREFSYSLLYHFPKLPKENLQSKFDAFPWIDNERYLKAWQNGQTGYPIVDAGMRELWQTGYMHNRVRMIVGSFLVKNLLLHWHHGEAWFWDCLFDADLANNSASWQWIAGSGADASPYFRIFNPITQGEKFDPDGTYTRQFCPELKDLPDKYLFKPWEAPESILKNANIVLGKNYPKPIVDVKASRQRALDAFQEMKSRS